jgi:hypothetical protein
MQAAIGYLRVSTREQGRRGVGLAAQRHEIERFKDYVVQATRDKRGDLILPTIKRQLAVVQIELQHFVWCVESYLKMGGSIALTQLYWRKYEPVVCWMYVVGLVDSDTLKEYFMPEQFLIALRLASGEIEPPPVPA